MAAGQKNAVTNYLTNPWTSIQYMCPFWGALFLFICNGSSCFLPIDLSFFSLLDQIHEVEMPAKTAQIMHHFFSLSIFYSDSCDDRLLPISHPNIFDRAWLITPNAFSTPSQPLIWTCTLWQTFARQVIWMVGQRRLASSCLVNVILD